MVLTDLGDYLTSQGAFTAGTNLFEGLMHTTPRTAVCLYEGPGAGPVHAFNGSAGQAVEEHVAIQVVSRSTDYATARANAQLAYRLLDGLPTRDINGVGYKWARARQVPFLMGRDEEHLPLIAFNVDVWKEQSSTS